MIVSVLLGTGVVLFLVWYFWKRRPLQLSVVETLQQVALLLALKETNLQKYPNPILTGNYFGFRIAVEGSPKKEKQARERGFRFLTNFSLPKKIGERIFLLNEKRNTSFKPIAELGLVHSQVAEFDRKFLLLSSDVALAQSVFQPYLCEKILSLSESHWQLDVHEATAHFEVWQSALNAQTLSRLLETIAECLNSISSIFSECRPAPPQQK